MDAPKFVLPVNQDIDNEIFNIMRQQLEFCIFSIITHGDVHQNVHLVRQTTKHLRAYLMLIKPKIIKKLFLKNEHFYKDSAAALSNIRDLHTQYELFIKASENLNIFNTPVFITIRNFYFTALEEEISRIKSMELVETLHRNLEEEAAILSKVTASIDSRYAYKKIIKLNKKAKRHYHKLTLADKAKEFHHLRTWVKYLSVQLSLFRADYSESPVHHDHENLTKLAHLLGIEHDHHALLKTLDSLPDVRTSFKYMTLLKPSLQEERDILRKKILKMRDKVFRD